MRAFLMEDTASAYAIGGGPSIMELNAGKSPAIEKQG